MSKNILSEKYWGDAKAVVLDGLNEKKRAMLDRLLENYRSALVEREGPGILTENAAITSTTSGNIAQINKLMLPLIRRVMPTVIANELVGMQPMTGPVGQISTIRTRYAETAGQPNPVIAGTEALGPYDIARAYSGNNNTDVPGAAATAAMEGFGGRKVKIEIVKTMVEAKTRRLSADYTFEAQQDASSQYGIDLEAEIMSAIATEITTEIDQEILLNLRRLPGTPDFVYDQNAITGVPTFVGDEHAAFASLVNRASNLIGQRTRRNSANWMVVSPVVLTILQNARTSAFARTTEGNFEAPTNVKFAGTLNNVIKVYVDTYASDSEVALLGLKNNETDAALIYAPYVPLMSTGVLLSPITYQPTVSFFTRYAIAELTNSASSFGNAADYVSSIAIANARFI